ncbi:hypothetical protein NL532_17045 [Mesorhizobium sp. C120A]|uniref:COG3904 family protein n=1 Tax=unclassified Mesorhizobium TaxID=325217 RepID=UPI001FDA4BF1|nr:MULTISPECIES: hypothetical protein [unclassified Mesorhizobium]WJI42401.1 hypothetical protein NL532_17045 [Mesorhizobium sp. C120A]
MGLPFVSGVARHKYCTIVSKLLQAPSPQLLWIALRGLPGVVLGQRSDTVGRWRRGLVRLSTVAAMAMAAFAAKAEDASPGTWQTVPPLQGVLYPTDPTIWTDDHSEMQFVVTRSSAPGCEPNCPEWISAEGDISAGTPALLKRTLKKLGSRKLPIIVNSFGGNVNAALELGRIIRKNKLDIAVGKTEFSDCWPGTDGCGFSYGKGSAYLGRASDGASCNSACPLMFAGGVRRVAGGWNYLGVHQITTTWFPSTTHYRTTYRVKRGKKYRVTTQTVTQGESYKTYEMSKGYARKISAYLREMGIGQGVLDLMKATPASDIRQIGLHDMLTMKLATSTDTLELFTRASLCMFDPPAPNCREVPGPAGKPTPPVAATTVAVKLANVAAKPAAVTKPLPDPAAARVDMSFVVVRGSDQHCTPQCPQWISAQGAITPQTPQKLRQLLDTLGNRRLPVVISSRGGDLFSALATGRIIHEKKLDVAVGRTDIGDPVEDGIYAGLSFDAGADCDSACALMLAGGARRFVGPQARLSFYLMGQKQLVKTYLNEMAISPRLFTALQDRFAERELDPDMMLEVGLTTGPQSVDALTGPGICKSVPKAENCRVAPSPNAQAEAPAKL